MSEVTTKEDIKKLADFVAETLDNRKGIDIEVIDISGQSSLADYFVIASGRSGTQVKALADEVELKLKEEYGLESKSSEGFDSREWILLDYIDIIVHIFTENTREFYQLERLWRNSESGKIERN